MYRLRVSVVAMEAQPWELEQNYLRLEAYVREAARRSAELVTAPEAILDGLPDAWLVAMCPSFYRIRPDSLRGRGECD